MGIWEMFMKKVIFAVRNFVVFIFIFIISFIVSVLAMSEGQSASFDDLSSNCSSCDTTNTILRTNCKVCKHTLPIWDSKRGAKRKSKRHDYAIEVKVIGSELFYTSRHRSKSIKMDSIIGAELNEQNIITLYFEDKKQLSIDPASRGYPVLQTRLKQEGVL
jgi:uncharacterized membrane protein